MDDFKNGEYFVSRDVAFIEIEFSYTNNIVDSSLTENDVINYSVDNEESYVQDDMEEQQAPTSDEEYEVNIKMGNYAETHIDVNTRVGQRGINMGGPMVFNEQLGKIMWCTIFE